MIPRTRWVSLAVCALLTAASACLAAELPGYKPGKGGIGAHFGGSWFGADRALGSEWFGDYSHGAQPRFSFAANFRYVVNPRWRWQVSPGFTWAAYKTATPIPYTDPNFPADTTKDEVLALLVPLTAQLQYVVHRGQWIYHAGAGPGLYRVWVENHRKVLKDPATNDLHRGVYPGASFELGFERFLRTIDNLSVELNWSNHLVFAVREDQFPSGFDSNLMAMEWRVGVNYYFQLMKPKPVPTLPGVK